MATHPKRAKHALPPSQGPGIATLARLAADYQGHADTLRKAIDLLTLHQTVRKGLTIPAALDQAIALDHARRANGSAPKTRAPNGTLTAARRRKREATAALLATFDAVEPRDTGGNRVGVLIQHGFLKRKGKGYIRTAKPFTP